MENKNNLLLTAAAALVLASDEKPSLPVRIALVGLSAALTTEIILDIRRLLNGRSKAED